MPKLSTLHAIASADSTLYMRQGYDLLVGGGMGRTHRNGDTFPRLADPLGYVDKDDILHAVKAIVATQRDYGRRDDRKQVRLACNPSHCAKALPAWSGLPSGYSNPDSIH